MAIQVISQWRLNEGKTINDALSVIKDAGDLIRQHGASSIRLSEVRIGRNPGTFYVNVTYDNLTAYGTAQDRLNANTSYQTILQQTNSIATLRNRSVVETLEL
jgi:hypothetical protein